MMHVNARILVIVTETVRPVRSTTEKTVPVQIAGKRGTKAPTVKISRHFALRFVMDNNCQVLAKVKVSVISTVLALF
ncbi:MAG: hypothetical protein LBC76_08610 [Treponema sp.]|nr:hypothetical protein [Treponema sp.]